MRYIIFSLKDNVIKVIKLIIVLYLNHCDNNA